MTQPLWTLTQIRLSGPPRGPRLSLDTLELFPGTTAILGSSGAGKTSLLNVLVGYDAPESGSVRFHGLSARDDSPPEGISLYWVPPQEGLWPHLTVRDHLVRVLPQHRRGSDRVDELLNKFDLREVQAAFPQTLSQGERGRLAVARALATEAQILVLDEPLGGVDGGQAERYWQALRQEREERQLSLVLATHHPEVVLREATQVVCLEQGLVAYAGRVADLYYAPPNLELARYLGPINWIPRDESNCWIGTVVEQDVLIRPEQIRIEPAAQGELIVERVEFSGSFETVELDHPKVQQRRRFYHRPVRPMLQTGMQATIRLLTVWLVCLLCTGCTSAARGRVLSAKSTRSWNLTAVKSSLPAPRAVHAATTGELFVLDNAGRVLVYDAERKLSRQWFMPDYAIGKPEKIRRLRDGRIAVADTHYHRVVIFDERGQVLTMFGSKGEGPGQFIYPVALDEDDQGYLYVCEYGGNDRVQKFDAQGKFVLAFGKFGTNPGEFQRPSGILWRDHQLYVVDAFNNRVMTFNEQGKFLGTLGEAPQSNALNYPYDLAGGDRGELYIVEYGGNCVTRLSAQGTLLGRYGLPGSNVEPPTTPWGITRDQQGRIYVADTGNRRVTEIQP